MDTLTIACNRCDTTEALFTGEIGVEGADVTMHTERSLADIFAQVAQGHAHDAAEFGLTFYLRLLDKGLPYVAIPVFPTRVFRHSCVWVNADSGIAGPEDLLGRTIGEFGTYGQDSGVYAKGVLMNEYGFKPAANRWVIGGLDRPAAPFEFTPHPHPADVDVTTTDQALGDLLDTGAIDALFTANIPQRVLDGSPNIRRLFPDYAEVERDYHARTGIFPIMHAIVVRRELVDGRPDLVRAIQAAFTAAKDAGAERYRRRARLYQAQTMVPWMSDLVERNARDFPADWWAYGIEANRPTLEAFLRHHHEQGLSRRWTVDEVFVDPVAAS